MALAHSYGAVVYRQKRGRRYFLLLKHVNGNHWSYPKGHVEPGETEVETARREIAEETGLSVELTTEFRAEITYTPPQAASPKRVVFFLARAEKKKLQLQADEISNGVWLEAEDALKLLTHADTAAVLRQAQQFLDRA